jgi:FlaA1/EpsC-like NDP-sugar epimerase
MRIPVSENKLVELGRIVTGRPKSLFEEDYQKSSARLREAFEGKRILVVGAAGSIGSSTVRCLLEWSPKETFLVDTAENNLVELLREIRSDAALSDANLTIQPIDFGSPMMERVLRNHSRFDWIFNFAAVKHVRSERDVPSLLQMMDTNLIKADRFLGWVRSHGHGQDGVFFVSSDKAANPANIMGATKRVMELLLFWHGSPESQGLTLAGAPCFGPPLRSTTARFANVAFSDGSLLLGFLNRISKNQPLAGPSNIRRYFVTLEEAGQICCLAAALPKSGEILVPRLSPETDLRDFKGIASLVLSHYGYTPRWCESEAEARSAGLSPSEWPCYFAPANTMGEKEFEEFVAKNETTREIGLTALQVVNAQRHSMYGDLEMVIQTLDRWKSNATEDLEKNAILRCLQRVVGSMDHVDSRLSLDQRM